MCGRVFCMYDVFWVLPEQPAGKTETPNNNTDTKITKSKFNIYWFKNGKWWENREIRFQTWDFEEVYLFFLIWDFLVLELRETQITTHCWTTINKKTELTKKDILPDWEKWTGVVFMVRWMMQGMRGDA